MNSGGADDALDKGIEEFHVETSTTFNNGQDEINSVDEKLVTRKLDLHIMPWLFFMWYVSSMRSMLPLLCSHNLTCFSGSSDLWIEPILEMPPFLASPVN
jgi:hypothetical protein